jgi:hypothetical protein
MSSNKCLIPEIILSVFIFNIIIISDITTALSINERLDLASDANITTANNKTNNITNSNNYSSGDPYVEEVYEDCVRTKDMSTCAKFRVLKYFHEMIPSFEEVQRNNTIASGRQFELWGPITLAPLPAVEAMRNDGALFPGLKQGPADSEFVKLLRFTLREVERFLRSYGLLVPVPVTESSIGDAADLETPRLIDDLFSGNLGGEINEISKLSMLLSLQTARQTLESYGTDCLDVTQCSLVEIY